MGRISDYHSILRNDPKLFGEVVCKQITRLGSDCIVHREIYDAHIKRVRRLVLIAPRGISKTSVASTICTLHDLAYDREACIGLFKKTTSQALNDLANIVDILRYGDEFNSLYGEFEFIVDRQEKIYVRNPRTNHVTLVFAAGAGQSVRGFVRRGQRLTKGVLDDFEDEKNTATPEQRSKIRTWLSAHVVPMLDPSKGRLLAIGTIAHQDSWLARRWNYYRQKREQGEEHTVAWPVIFHQLTENGESIWPQMYSLSTIARIKKEYVEQGELDKFFMEYYNIPYDAENAAFRKENIKYWDGELQWDEVNGTWLEITSVMDSVGNQLKSNLKVPVDVYIGYDLSAGESLDADYTGRLVVGIDVDGNRYNINCFLKRVHFDKIKDLFFDDYSRYHPRMQVVEKEAHARVMQFWLKEEMVKRNTYIPLFPEIINTRLKKERKLAMALQPIYSSGVVHHRRSDTELEEELFSFPRQSHDDLMDGAYLAHKKCVKPSKKVITNITKFIKKAISWDWRTGASDQELTKYRERNWKERK